MSNKNSTIAKVGQRRQVVIPKEMCEHLGLGEGDFVEVTSAKGGVLSAEDAKSLRRGLAQAKRGQTRAWDKIKADREQGVATVLTICAKSEKAYR
jgi:AbrB family looped-hinge helix DNA binding protein